MADQAQVFRALTYGPPYMRLLRALNDCSKMQIVNITKVKGGWSVLMEDGSGVHLPMLP